MARPAVEFIGVNKWFGSFHVLRQQSSKLTK